MKLFQVLHGAPRTAHGAPWSWASFVELSIELAPWSSMTAPQYRAVIRDVIQGFPPDPSPLFRFRQ